MSLVPDTPGTFCAHFLRGCGKAARSSGRCYAGETVYEEYALIAPAFAPGVRFAHQVKDRKTMNTPHETRVNDHRDALADEAMREARRIFHRTLASWASDLLLLRQRGLLTTAWPHARDDEEIRSSAA